MAAQIIPFPVVDAPARPGPDDAELELLRFVAEGFTPAEIGERFDAPGEAVDLLLDDLLAKLHARSPAQAVAICLRRGLMR